MEFCGIQHLHGISAWDNQSVSRGIKEEVLYSVDRRASGRKEYTLHHTTRP